MNKKSTIFLLILFSLCFLSAQAACENIACCDVIGDTATCNANPSCNWMTTKCRFIGPCTTPQCCNDFTPDPVKCAALPGCFWEPGEGKCVLDIGGGGACTPDGDSCNSDTDCCSGKCNNNNMCSCGSPSCCEVYTSRNSCNIDFNCHWDTCTVPNKCVFGHPPSSCGTQCCCENGKAPNCPDGCVLDSAGNICNLESQDSCDDNTDKISCESAGTCFWHFCQNKCVENSPHIPDTCFEECCCRQVDSEGICMVTNNCQWDGDNMCQYVDDTVAPCENYAGQSECDTDNQCFWDGSMCHAVCSNQECCSPQSFTECVANPQCHYDYCGHGCLFGPYPQHDCQDECCCKSNPSPIECEDNPGCFWGDDNWCHLNSNCVVDGNSCSSNSQCCSGYCCAGGQCCAEACGPDGFCPAPTDGEGGSTCKSIGEMCSTNSQCCGDTVCQDYPDSFSKCCYLNGEDNVYYQHDCCSNYWVDGVCRCKPDSEYCQQNSECCSDNCDTETSLCTTPCIENNIACTADHQCCSNNCQNNRCECIEPGQRYCIHDYQCCNGNCDTGTNSCVDDRTPECKNIGDYCKDHYECCSERCANGRCCSSFGDYCEFDKDCCSGSCDTSKKTCTDPDVGDNCGKVGSFCRNGYDCCRGLDCMNNRCEDRTNSCKRPFEPCKETEECCNVLECVDEECCATGYVECRPDPKYNFCCSGYTCKEAFNGKYYCQKDAKQDSCPGKIVGENACCGNNKCDASKKENLFNCPQDCCEAIRLKTSCKSPCTWEGTRLGGQCEYLESDSCLNRGQKCKEAKDCCSGNCCAGLCVDKSCDRFTCSQIKGKLITIKEREDVKYCGFELTYFTFGDFFDDINSRTKPNGMDLKVTTRTGNVLREKIVFNEASSQMPVTFGSLWVWRSSDSGIDMRNNVATICVKPFSDLECRTAIKLTDKEKPVIHEFRFPRVYMKGERESIEAVVTDDTQIKSVRLVWSDGPTDTPNMVELKPSREKDLYKIDFETDDLPDPVYFQLIVVDVADNEVKSKIETSRQITLDYLKDIFGTIVDFTKDIEMKRSVFGSPTFAVVDRPQKHEVGDKYIVHLEKIKLNEARIHIFDKIADSGESIDIPLPKDDKIVQTLFKNILITVLDEADNRVFFKELDIKDGRATIFSAVIAKLFTWNTIMSFNYVGEKRGVVKLTNQLTGEEERLSLNYDKDFEEVAFDYTFRPPQTDIEWFLPFLAFELGSSEFMYLEAGKMSEEEDAWEYTELEEESKATLLKLYKEKPIEFEGYSITYISGDEFSPVIQIKLADGTIKAVTFDYSDFATDEEIIETLHISEPLFEFPETDMIPVEVEIIEGSKEMEKEEDVFCGDGSCDFWESVQSCPDDCTIDITPIPEDEAKQSTVMFCNRDKLCDIINDKFLVEKGYMLLAEDENHTSVFVKERTPAEINIQKTSIALDPGTKTATLVLQLSKIHKRQVIIIDLAPLENNKLVDKQVHRQIVISSSGTSWKTRISGEETLIDAKAGQIGADPAMNTIKVLIPFSFFKGPENVVHSIDPNEFALSIRAKQLLKIDCAPGLREDMVENLVFDGFKPAVVTNDTEAYCPYLAVVFSKENVKMEKMIKETNVELCGNAHCGEEENCINCPVDCVCDDNSFCDIVSMTCKEPVCGNKVCETSHENSENCCSDCFCEEGLTCIENKCEKEMQEITAENPCDQLCSRIPQKKLCTEVCKSCPDCPTNDKPLRCLSDCAENSFGVGISTICQSICSDSANSKMCASFCNLCPECLFQENTQECVISCTKQRLDVFTATCHQSCKKADIRGCNYICAKDCQHCTTPECTSSCIDTKMNSYKEACSSFCNDKDDSLACLTMCHSLRKCISHKNTDNCIKEEYNRKNLVKQIDVLLKRVTSKEFDRIFLISSSKDVRKGRELIKDIHAAIKDKDIDTAQAKLKELEELVETIKEKQVQTKLKKKLEKKKVKILDEKKKVEDYIKTLNKAILEENKTDEDFENIIKKSEELNEKISLEINAEVLDVIEDNVTENVTVMTLTVTNDQNGSLSDLNLIQEIPKEIAVSVSDLIFDVSVEIIEDDPVIAWNIEELAEGETAELQFSVKKEIDEKNLENVKSSVVQLDTTPPTNVDISADESIDAKKEKLIKKTTEDEKEETQDQKDDEEERNEKEAKKKSNMIKAMPMVLFLLIILTMGFILSTKTRKQTIKQEFEEIKEDKPEENEFEETFEHMGEVPVQKPKPMAPPPPPVAKKL